VKGESSFTMEEIKRYGVMRTVPAGGMTVSEAAQALGPLLLEHGLLYPHPHGPVLVAILYNDRMNIPLTAAGRARSRELDIAWVPYDGNIRPTVQSGFMTFNRAEDQIERERIALAHADTNNPKQFGVTVSSFIQRMDRLGPIYSFLTRDLCVLRKPCRVRRAKLYPPARLRFLGGGFREPFFETGPNFGFRPKSLSVIGSKSSK